MPKPTKQRRKSITARMANDDLVEFSETKGVGDLIRKCTSIATKADREDVSSMWKCFAEYVEYCQKNNIIMTHRMAYLAMGIDKYVARDFKSGKRKAANPEFKELIDRVLSILDASLEQNLIEGKIKEVTGIWLQKIQSHDVEPKEEYEEPEEEHVKTAAEIAEKYQDMLIDTPDQKYLKSGE